MIFRVSANILSMDIKLIATDLDGTLLMNHAASCSKEAIDLVTKLVKKGIYVMPASGRQLPNLQNLFKDVDGELAYLCENGALISYKDEVLYKTIFDQDLALELCHMIMDEPRAEVLISGERTSYIVPKSQGYVDYLRYEVKNNVTIVERPEDIEESIIKVSYYISPEVRDELTEKFVAQVNGRCQHMVSGNEWVDFAPHGTSKGDAMRAFGEKFGILPEEMAAFGDNENDRSMLEFVGHPYLMKACNPTMEDVQAMRVERVEDQLREILEHLS